MSFAKQKISLYHTPPVYTHNTCSPKETTKKQQGTSAKLNALLRKFFSNFCRKTPTRPEMASKST